MQVLDGQAQLALAAADVVLVASGTATLETTARASDRWSSRIGSGALTAWLLRTFNLMKAPFFSQPNLLAGERVVPELFQEQVTPRRWARRSCAQLDDPAAREALENACSREHPSAAAPQRQRSRC